MPPSTHREIIGAPFWFEDAGALKSSPQNHLPENADCVIIGGGLTGLSAARTLVKRGQHVIVLDAGSPGGGASCRNGGMVGGGHRLSWRQLSAEYGADLAQRLLHEAHLDSVSFVKQLIDEEKLACDFAECGRLRCAWTTADYDNAGRELEQLQKHLPLEAEMLPKQRQQQELATDLYAGGIVYHRHGSLNPAKFVAGLLQAASRAGATVIGNTPVTAIAEDNNALSVKTLRGRIRAGKVLIATNGYTPPCFPRLQRRVVPVPSFLCATAPLGKDAAAALIPGGKMIVETRARHCYYRLSPDGERLVFGARAAMHNTVSEKFARRQLRGLIREIFPSLEKVELSHSWRGLTGFSFDLLPNVGKQGNVWHALAYCGNGNSMAPWLGHNAALLMLGDNDNETAFFHTHFSDRRWYAGRPWFLPLATAAFRLRDLHDYWRR